MRSVHDPIYQDGVERVTESCAAWLDGITRHQVREVHFEVLIAGDVFAVVAHRKSDGGVRAIFEREGGGGIVYSTKARASR